LRGGDMPLPLPKAPAEQVAGAAAGRGGCDPVLTPMLRSRPKSNGKCAKSNSCLDQFENGA